MRRLLRILARILIIVLTLLIALGAGGYLWLRGALPQMSGTIRVQGNSAPVEIRRDTDMVPHIRAQSDADALFGLGYVHAQDRLWQMEFQRRIGNGRLSEILGTTTLDTDKFLRTIGTARAARSAWTQLDPEGKRLIEAYVAGINSFLTTHHGRELPIEFTILGFAPEPWQPEDVVVWQKMMAWNLGGNWEDELLRLKLNAKLGKDQADQLMPAYSATGPIIVSRSTIAAARTTRREPSAACPTCAPVSAARYDRLIAIDQTLQDVFGLGGEAIGSNNWVISGSRTQTGKPLLANDPHLGSQIPSVWYLAHITGGAFDAIGATLPGVPGIVIGHNQRIAWGVTNTGPDVQDLFLERINDRNQVEYKDSFEPMRIVQEVIKIKGQPDVSLNVRITRHGPLISDVVDEPSTPAAFRWTALDEEDATIVAFLQLNRAKNWQDFTAALRHYHAPMQNFVYADVDGNIGYYAPGALPVRASGDGTVPAPGWSGKYDWRSYVPFDQLPHTYNPSEGYIVTANNKVVPDTYPYLISSSWAAPYRATRIIEMIKNKSKVSIDDVAAMQADVQSVQVRELLPFLLQLDMTAPQAKAAQELLRQWDGSVRGDTAQAAIFEAWYQQIPKHVLADNLGDDVWSEYARHSDYIAKSLPALLQQGSVWCDDMNTQEQETCAVIIERALVDGLAQMARAQKTDNMKSWRWDNVHYAIFPHNPFDGVAPLKAIFSRSIPNGGDHSTVNVAPVQYSDPYNQYRVASYRQIIDLSNFDSSRFMQTVGQSGHLLSSHYSDLIPRWQRVEYISMRYSEEEIHAATKYQLILAP